MATVTVGKDNYKVILVYDSSNSRLDRLIFTGASITDFEATNLTIMTTH